uniref:Uncharacterized protein n=1 Tax=Megaselia scalaris TaxID=36166 RepID=T1GUM5_MEGSC
MASLFYFPKPCDWGHYPPPVKRSENFQVVSKYVLPFIIASIVLGIWGMNICVRMINGIVMESKMM